MAKANLTVGSFGTEVADLHQRLAQTGNSVPTTEVSRQFFGPGTRQAVQQFQKSQGLPATGQMDEATTAALNIKATRPGTNPSTPPAKNPARTPPIQPPGVPPGTSAPPSSGTGSVSGYLTFDYGMPAANMTVRAYNVGFAGQVTKLGETKTDSTGQYSLSYPLPGGTGSNLQMRVADSNNNEVTISNTKFNAQQQETMNLVVPGSVQPLAPEFQRLSADMDKYIGGVAKLSQAEESQSRQDITLLTQSSNWDARILAVGSSAAQLAAPTGLGQEVLYALLRAGLPIDPSLLAMVPSDTVQNVLTKASQAGIVGLSDQQVSAATSAFQTFATKARLKTITPGALSSFSDLFAAVKPTASEQQTFASLYFNNPSAPDLWTQAANLKISQQTIDALRLQGKFLYLTFNNAPLAQKLQNDVGSLADISKIADLDYHLSDTWQTTLQQLVTSGQTIDNLIPSSYAGDSNARLAAYAGDLARKVRLSFPTHVAARMIERKELPLSEKTAPQVASFLRAAIPLGYNLGRTPLNSFLMKANQTLPSMDADSRESLKTLHRLYQVTPSTESLQAALNLGFTSAYDIASHTKEEFLEKYASAFPAGEAQLIYGHAQTVKSVTFNLFSMAKQLDTAPPVYAFSPSNDSRQAAKNAIVQQFPSMASLFGNLDYCQCEDCRSVLSPAAYFVDLLEFLKGSSANSAQNTPLDVLIGSDKIAGRRPDLGALPLTCENTNTKMPYIDVVNEILEYYVANSYLDANYAYDTGSATTADLTAEPQHVLPQAYKTLQQALFPLNLPFDLWIETVRGFLSYFKTPLVQVLDTMRPVDNLELFTDVDSHPYYRAQILAEQLGLSPSDYQVLTATDLTSQTPSVQNWFQLYGYATENIALNGQGDIPPLKSAKNLAQQLGLTYQELADCVETGFLNPGLYPLIAQFKRFGINMSDAFSYTNQPGYPAFTSQQTLEFEALLQGITAQYHALNNSSTFDAKAWIKSALPANYSAKVLVLADPESGCNFSGTSLQYADNATAATPLDYLKFNLFVRLWKKLGWTLHETDRALQLFFPATLPAWGDATFATAFSSAWKTALVYLAHLDDLNTKLAPAMGRLAILHLWSNISVQGKNSLYSQLFLTSSVLNSDWAFDDPRGQFPIPLSDFDSTKPLLAAFSTHQAAVQGVLGLSSDEIAAILADAGSTVDTVSVLVNALNSSIPSFTLNNLSICYRYSLLANCLQMKVLDLISLKQISGLNPFQNLPGTPLSVLADDVAFNRTLLFVKNVAAVQNSGFTIDDLNFLLRHKFDPVGPYATDPNALITLVQSIVSGLRQIQAQNAVPPNLASMSESLIDQTLSGLFPSTILKALFALLTNSQTVTASLGSVAAGLDPTPFADEKELTFNYDSVTQTQSVSFEGLLLDWKKADFEKINSSPTFSSLLDGIQKQGLSGLNTRIDEILGVWASLVQYESAKAPLAAAIDATSLTQTDPAISLSYDQTDKLQWLGYRGVLTDSKRAALQTVNSSADLQQLLSDVQGQALPAYEELIGSFLAMWANGQTYEASASGNQIDAGAFLDALTAAQQAGTIGAVVPQIQFRYDSVSQVQTVTCTGVLTDSLRGKFAALIPSPVFPGLLQSVRAQAVELFQAMAANLLTVTDADLDTYVGPFLGLNVIKQQRQVKANLIAVFLPLLAHKLSAQFLLQAVAASSGSDPSLIERLATDAALLSDPSEAGKPVLNSLLSLEQQGVSVSCFTSTNGSGAPQATGTAATADTADPIVNQPGIHSAHFEGYMQVPTDGPYRFFAELGDAGAAALFRLDPPDTSPLMPNPIIPSASAAAQDNVEISRFVDLKGGLPYHFTLDFSNLGPKGASLLVQGENLPKGPLNQIVLYPQQAVVAFTRANTLLAKALRILQVTTIDEREISYMVANSAQFSNLRLSSLPTQGSDDTPANSAELFSQFLALVDYADLRKGPAGGTNALIDVFENVGQTFSEAQASQDTNLNLATPWAALANLTRREAATVRTIGEYFGLIDSQIVNTDRQVTALTDFGNNKGIRRIWDALQLVQVIGIPAAALTDSTAICSAAPDVSSTSPDVIATNFKNAVKAQYKPNTWRPVAQSVFDKLRQKKRDALVTYLVNKLDLENSNQLFEYFLVDPGMEPVVQTSRLRLAMSSVQTFIQRCLLDLENGNSQPALNVAPRAIDADWWAWMKRYRVWQANREIFLFPENWMESELRLDKTDLFEELEGTLLQGDVTSDLVEDAFFTYLKGLDVRARLDIVSMYFDQNLTDTDISTLYVLGRTYGHPHKYFYRTYSSSTWSGWVPVTPDIESDHVVMAIWKGRLNLFWVTFIQQAQPPAQPAATGDTTPVSSLDFGHLATNIYAGAPMTKVQVQLHWAEYVQGKWSNRVSSDVNTYGSVLVNTPFNPKKVFIHISKEMDATGTEGALRIHLDFPVITGPSSAFNRLASSRVSEVQLLTMGSEAATAPSAPVQIGGGGYAFRVTSRNSAPDFQAVYSLPAPAFPYDKQDVDATLYTGSGVLQSSFQTDIVASDHSSTPTSETILQRVNAFALLPCANPVVPSPFLDQSEPLYQEAGSLASPFFFADKNNPQVGGNSGFQEELTFFVQPTLTENTIDQWEGWAVPPPTRPQEWLNPAMVDQINLAAQVPKSVPTPIDRIASVYAVKDTADWLTNPATAVSFGSAWVGQSGGFNVAQNTSLANLALVTSAIAGRGGSVMPGVATASVTLVGKGGLSLSQVLATGRARVVSSAANLGALVNRTTL